MTASGTGFDDVLLLVGKLNYTWTNTESLLIHLLAGLARVDMEIAAIVFLTLGTGKARIELVERLAKTRRTPEGLRKDVLGLTGRMTRQGRVRNKYSHCIYSFDEDGAKATTRLMRIFDGDDEVRYGKVEDLGARELKAIGDSIAELRAVNRGIWDLVDRQGFPR